MNQIYDVIIIGGGPGGYTAALYCARAGLTVLLVEKLAPGGQMATTTQIDNYPGFENGIDGFELGTKMKLSADRFGAITELAEVTAVNLNSEIKSVKTTNGIYEAKTVILATGASPRELGVPEEHELHGRGITYCATCDGMFYRGKAVAVVGGGDTAAADALFLARICKKVYLIHRRNTLRASVSYLPLLEKNENIEFVFESVVEKVLHDDFVTGITVKNVRTGENSEIAVDGVFVAVGRVPNSGLFKNVLEMDEQGYVVADETTRSSLPGVFAVGDLRTKPLRQIVTAASDGATASKYVEEYLLSLEAK